MKGATKRQKHPSCLCSVSIYLHQEKTPTGLSKSTMSVEEFETLVAPHRMPLSKWHSECEIPETDVIGGECHRVSTSGTHFFTHGKTCTQLCVS